MMLFFFHQNNDKYMGLTLQKIKTLKKWRDSDNVNVTNTDTFQVNWWMNRVTLMPVILERTRLVHKSNNDKLT